MRYSCVRRRGRLLIIGLLASLLVTAGCGSSSSKGSGSSKAATNAAPTAATVAGTKVSLTAVTGDLKAEAAAGKKGKAKTDPSNPLAAPKTSSGGYTQAATAAALTNRIRYELYDQQLRSHHAKVAAEDKAAARQSLCSDPTTGQPASGTSCPPLDAYPAAYRTFQLTLSEREVAFQRLLYGRVFDKVKRAEPKLLKEICLNLVQVADASVSKQVVASMKGGASMADAAKKAAAAGKASSVQPGCLFLAVAPVNLAKAKQGAVVPVTSGSVIGVAEVTSFKTGTKTDFVAQPPSSVASVQKLFKTEVDGSIRKAKVTVPTKYGHWDRTQLIVVAPKSKSTTTSAPSTSGTPSTTKPSTSSTTSTTAG